MKFTYNWLKDYLDTNLDAATIANTLTNIGLEIDEVSYPILPIAAKITECVKHPTADNLNILTLDDGSGVPRTVVCGAPNVRMGLVSALALPGCAIGGVEIKSGKVRGIQSDGMMCSARELGISDDNSGIIELRSASEIIGKTISALVDLADAVFDAGITPNRGDYLAVRGIARDLSASGLGKYKHVPENVLPDTKSGRGVKIENGSACPVYRLCEIRGIKNGPSNNLISSRLSAIGINPKNAAIDATNYICYDMCQPMHCFDADEIHGDIIIRNAAAGEKFKDLFGNEHTLLDSDLVIADGDGILALAGIIGGLRGMTTDNTTNIILESAYFDPITIRKTSKRIGVSTDASYRYERGIDGAITGAALFLASKIITDECGGEIVAVSHAGADLKPNIRINYSPSLCMKKAGIDIPVARQKEILESLGFIVNVAGDDWTVIPTSARVDILVPENILSELLRIYGYDKIISMGTYATPSVVSRHGLNIGIKRQLTGRGLSERISFGFGNALDEKVISDKPSIMMANPITAELDTARNNLLANMLNAVRDNEKRAYTDLSLFELGTIFDGDVPGAQHTGVVIVRTGNTSPRHWQKRNRPFDVFDVKADITALIGHQDFTISTENAPIWANPFRYGAIFSDNNKIAEFGELHPMVARHFGIKTSVMVGLVDDISKLPNTHQPKQIPISEFQPITRDFAFVMNSDFMADKLLKYAMSADIRISDGTIFDNFDMGGGARSIGFNITIIPNTNMSDVDLLEIQNKIIETIEQNCPAKLRV